MYVCVTTFSLMSLTFHRDASYTHVGAMRRAYCPAGRPSGCDRLRTIVHACSVKSFALHTACIHCISSVHTCMHFVHACNHDRTHAHCCTVVPCVCLINLHPCIEIRHDSISFPFLPIFHQLAYRVSVTNSQALTKQSLDCRQDPCKLRPIVLRLVHLWLEDRNVVKTRNQAFLFSFPFRTRREQGGPELQGNEAALGIRFGKRIFGQYQVVRGGV